jgi:hypothetical protein
VRERLKRLSWRAFAALDRAGLHVLPKHYYTPVADRAWLRAHPELWRRPLELAWDLDAQLAWLRQLREPYLDEVAGFRAYERLVARANAAEGRPKARITTVEPSPRGPLATLEGIELLRASALEAPAALVAELAEGDLLFVDSSHAVKTGSELSRVYLELVPRLAPGVTVHVHDVYLPYLYSPFVLEDYFDPQETALVAALLAGNDALEVLCCESALHHERQPELRELLPDYRPQPLADGLARGPLTGHFPSSLWLRTRPARG